MFLVDESSLQALFSFLKQVLLKNFLLFVLCACMFCLRVRMYTMCVPSALRGQNSISDPLALELQRVVSLPVGAGD